MPKISIIVPVYKVEKYLDKCVKSILAQTFKDFELILVDDGSPDNCGKMCDDYAKQDNRIIVLHKENGGLSDARNAGIGIAKGQYLGFVDSDDYIAPDMYEVLYKNLVENDADMSCCGTYDCYENKDTVQAVKSDFFVFSKVKAIEYFLSGKGIGLYAVNKIYSKSLFDNIMYPVGKIFEDAFIIVDILSNAEKVVVTTAPKYYYIRHNNSITISKFSKKYYDILDAHLHNMELIKKTFPQLKEVGEFRVWWAYKQILSVLAIDDKKNRLKFKDDYKNISKKIRRNIFPIIKNNYNSLRQKFMYIVIAISPKLFMHIYRKCNK